MFDRRYLFGLIASAAFIGLLLWRIDVGDTVQAFKKANYLLFLPAIGFYFVALAFRTLRWRIMLLPLSAVSFGRLFPVMSVGYMANNLLPVRLGELVRSYYLGEREGISKSATLATIAVERVLDGVILLLLLVGVSLFLPVLGLVRDLSEDAGVPWVLLVLLMAAPFLLAMGLLVLAAYRPNWPINLLKVVSRPLPRRLAQKALDLATLFVGGLVVLRDPKRFTALIVLSLPVWLGEATMYYLVGVSFDLTSSLGGAGTMAAAILAATATSNLATALPASQGGIGPFEFFAAGTLVVLGAQREVATAYAVALHIALLVPVTILGLVYLWSGKQSLVKMARLGVRGNAEREMRGESDLAVAPEEAS